MKLKSLLLLNTLFFSLFLTNNISTLAQDDCSAVAPNPQGADGEAYCIGSNDFSNVLATSVPSAGTVETPNYSMVITYSDILTSTDEPIVIGLTEDGSYDQYNNLPAGNYCYRGFAYNQTEVNAIGEFLNDPANLPIIQLAAPSLVDLIPFPLPLDLSYVLDLAQGFVGEDEPGLSISSLEGTISTLGLLGLSVCYDIADVPGYCIEVVDPNNDPASLCNSTAVYEPFASKLLSIKPNPVVSQFQIDLPADVASTNQILSIYNTMGQLVKVVNLSNTSNVVRTDELSVGMYFCYLEHTTYAAKFVVAK